MPWCVEAAPLRAAMAGPFPWALKKATGLARKWRAVPVPGWVEGYGRRCEEGQGAVGRGGTTGGLALPREAGAAGGRRVPPAAPGEGSAAGGGRLCRGSRPPPPARPLPRPVFFYPP